MMSRYLDKSRQACADLKENYETNELKVFKFMMIFFFSELKIHPMDKI